MSDWKNELTALADAVTKVIAEDTYPASIRPVFLRDAVRNYPMLGGKRLRPALLLWSCGMFGGDPEKAMPAAAAIEIYHNWTLVHDDIIDNDDFRRGKPTTHKSLAEDAKSTRKLNDARAAEFGTDFAILAGDLQQSWAIHSMTRLAGQGVSAETVLFLIREMQQILAKELISGEACDVDFSFRDFRTVAEDEIRNMIDGKTGVILRFAMLAGAAIALGKTSFDDPRMQKAADFARHLALAFQVKDDYLGVFGDEKTFGKPLCSDFQEAKPTLLFLSAMRRCSGADKEKLIAYMGREQFTERDVDCIRTILTNCGAKDEIDTLIRKESEAALDCLHSLPDNSYRNLIEDLTNYLIQREI